jgi:hypothetical protein
MHIHVADLLVQDHVFKLVDAAWQLNTDELEKVFAGRRVMG